MEKDFVALRKLRDEDASGALKKYFGDSEDPRAWTDGDGDPVIVEVKDGRVTKLQLYECSSLVELPYAIGELGALKTLIFEKNQRAQREASPERHPTTCERSRPSKTPHPPGGVA